MPHANINGQKIFFQEMGQGRPAILMVHGAGCSSSTFLPLMHQLGATRRVIAIDLTGHGKNHAFVKMPPIPRLLETYCNTVADFAESLGLGRYILLGHSMGGAIAQLLALAFSERLSGLILVATGARLRISTAVLDTIRGHFSSLNDLIAMGGFSPTTDREQVRTWSQQMIQATQEVVLMDFLACDEFDVRGQIGQIACPTLIFSGKEDRITPPVLQVRLAELIAQSTLKHLSRSGHFLHMERPSEVANLMSQSF